EAVAKSYPDIETEHMLVDAFSQSVIRKPETFDVVVASNMFGDIITEVASVVQGGMGMAAGCNIGDDHAMFEPIHGSAPNMAGKESCNPIAMFLALAEAVRWVGNRKSLLKAAVAANVIENAVASVIAQGETLTYDIKEQPAAGTFDVAKAVADAILQADLTGKSLTDNKLTGEQGE
ncbi:MAG: isocitrate/isopropylmalate dehydrogenase, partial [Alteromonadaceae bacterium]